MKKTILSIFQKGFEVSFLVLFFVSITVFFFNPGQANAEKLITLKLTHFIKENTPMTNALKWWGEELMKRTGGKVKCKYFFGGALAKPPELLGALSTGMADVGPIIPVLSIAKTPIFTIGALPGAPTEEMYNAVMAAHKIGKTKAGQAEMRRNGLHFLAGHGHSGDFLFSSKPVKRLSDIKGMKISSFGPYAEAFKLWGAQVTWLGVAESYEGLKRGIADGANKPLIAGIIDSLYEVTPYLLEPKLGINVTSALVMNLQTWNKLPNDVKAVVDELSDEFPKKLSDQFAIADPFFAKQMKEKGMIFNRLPDEDVIKMREMMKPIWSKWAENLDKKGLPGTELKDQFYKWCLEGPK